MVVEIFSLWDKKAQIFGVPECAFNADCYKRLLRSRMLNATQASGVRDYPGDFQVFKVGWWNDAKGIVVPSDPPCFVCEVSAIRLEKEE